MIKVLELNNKILHSRENLYALRKKSTFIMSNTKIEPENLIRNDSLLSQENKGKKRNGQEIVHVYVDISKEEELSSRMLGTLIEKLEKKSEKMEKTKAYKFNIVIIKPAIRNKKIYSRNKKNEAILRVHFEIMPALKRLEILKDFYMYEDFKKHIDTLDDILLYWYQKITIGNFKLIPSMIEDAFIKVQQSYYTDFKITYTIGWNKMHELDPNSITESCIIIPEQNEIDDDGLFERFKNEICKAKRKYYGRKKFNALLKNLKPL